MPLQRHDALRSLSRDHHVALQLARALQSGTSPHLRAHLPTEPTALIAYVERVYTEELAPHFGAEDAVLAPTVRGKDAALDRLLREIEAEHASMTALVASLPSLGASELDAALDRLGRTLEAHVRREERECYARVQDLLDEPALEQLGAALGRHFVSLCAADIPAR